MSPKETIVASATPEGLSALSVIRVSGNQTFSIIKKCISEKDKFDKAKPNYIKIYTFIDNKLEPIDEITVIKYESPKSFTGEEMVEIICHGGEFIQKQIIHTLIINGARTAEKGEFTKRAFINGKLDIMKAEAIKALIESTNETENKIARNAYEGKYLKKIENIKDSIKNILADVEAEIEFEEDNIESINEHDLNELINEIDKEIKRRKKIKELDIGNKIVIAGPANAGKSTLYNLLLGYERSIIDALPGTTRDMITERVILDGKKVTLIDTAGIRETENKIESEGIIRSKKIINEATAVIWVSSSDEPLYKEEIDLICSNKDRVICFINKTDIKLNNNKEDFLNNEQIRWMNISLINNTEIYKIVEAISTIIQKHSIDLELPEIIIGERQEEITNEIMKELEKAKDEWNKKEIAAYFLKSALEKTEKLLGKIENEDILNKIFNKFCIGK